MASPSVHDPKSPLPFQPRDEDGPVFREPWEAQVFAMTVHLHAADYFTWPEWTEALSTEINAAKGLGEADLGDTYYHHWLRALEALVVGKGLETTSAIEERIETWRRAYLATPHGHSVELDAG